MLNLLRVLQILPRMRRQQIRREVSSRKLLAERGSKGENGRCYGCRRGLLGRGLILSGGEILCGEARKCTIKKARRGAFVDGTRAGKGHLGKDNHDSSRDGNR